jgi:hypothetical protein
MTMKISSKFNRVCRGALRCALTGRSDSNGAHNRSRLGWQGALRCAPTLLLSLALLFSSSFLFAFGKDNAGTSGAAFLKIGPGARPVGMGEAFTGVADDIHAIYWNPAGLATLKHAEITGMHMQYFQMIQYEFAAIAIPTAENGTWGVAITNLHTDNIDRRTEDTDEPIGQFSASDNAYWLSYGRRLNSRLSIGANAKYVHQNLDSVIASAYAADGGILYETDWHDLRLGASVQNLGSKVKFQNESDPLPLTIRAGASAPLLSRKLLASSDVIIPRDHQVGLALGGEYQGRLKESVGYTLRSGYRTDSDVDGFKGVSLGAGLVIGRTAFDFAWVPFGDLGNSYRFGLHVKFGPPEDGKNLRSARQLEQASNSSTHDTALEQLLSL